MYDRSKYKSCKLYGMIESKHNKNALSKYKTLLNKERKINNSLNETISKRRNLMYSISYPIFIKESKTTYIAHLGVSNKVVIKIVGRDYISKIGYEINSHYTNEKDSFYLYEYEIKNINNRITKKEFMLIYNEALNFIKEQMVLSTRSRKKILVEKTIIDTE